MGERGAKGEGLTVVGLGASAGGLRSLSEFLGSVASESGLAFVVVTHQHPDHVSLMPELLAKATTLPVEEARAGVRVEANHVYVAAPGALLELRRGLLHDRRSSREGEARSHLTIDPFFRSLAEDRGARAIVVLLSGAGSDGTIGAKIVKREGGVVLAEDPRTAGHDGMPQSAIEAGVVDHVAPAAELAKVALACAEHGHAPRERELSAELLDKVLELLLQHTGHDFSAYKKSTIRRRLLRRMKLRRLATPDEYLGYVRHNEAELELLFKELLIGVTNFFRDPKAFEALRRRVGDRLELLPAGASFRVWVPGCSTGEEAYSLAILLRELMLERGRPHKVEIFATDLDPSAIDTARAGVYAEGVAADLGPDRLERFFHQDEGGYRVRREIRDMVVFAAHNLLSDPPFMSLDLLSCRNLLIYLTSDCQRQLLPVFAYALASGGLLFLGSSESISGAPELFTQLDKSWKIFERIAGGARPRLPFRISSPSAAHQRAPGGPGFEAPPVARLIERVLLSKLVPPSVVVDERADILHIHGRTGAFLEPPEGGPNFNLFNMAREGLRPALVACLRAAKARGEEIRHPGARVRDEEGRERLVDLSVLPLSESELLRDGTYLVCFRARAEAEAEAGEGGAPATLEEAELGVVEALERELRYTKQSLQSTIEELEAANEEMRATNEELQSTNEELQSSNEELETSKEEMQSLNEELHTVNTELEQKVTELSQANDDMTNLLNSTEIATIFLDRELRIKRFTESATRVFKLIRSDIGRSIADLATELRYDSLVDDAREVLHTLQPCERELESKSEAWFLMRMIPYRTRENVIDGLVVTFVDISEAKRSSAALGRAQVGARQHDETLSLVLELAPAPMTVARLDRELRYRWICDPEAQVDATLGRRADELHPGEGGRRLLELQRRVLDSGGGASEAIDLEGPDGPHRRQFRVEPLIDEAGVVGVLVVSVEQAPAAS